MNPRLEARPGERRLWRVGNLSNQEFFTLSLEGHELHIVAIDGTPLPEVWTVDDFELVPGSRVEFVVDAAGEGSYKFKTSGYELDFPSGNYPLPASRSVTIRQRYTDFTGRWVYHCHILFHEDHGMMGTVLCTR